LFRSVALLNTIGCLGLAACGVSGESHVGVVDAEWVGQEARRIMSRVEQTVGLEYKATPGIEIRTKEQVRSYLLARLDSAVPPEELEGITQAYRLFRLIPDTLDLRALLISLYTEQVAGYYDPDSATLYVVEGADPLELKLVLAHELVHALQDQHMDVDSLLSLQRQNDRTMAAQAVLEGQATLASIAVIMPDQDVGTLPDFWSQFRETVRQQQESMPVLGNAPRLLKETLIFPYLAGADFVRWFLIEYPDWLPFGERMPTSSEHILHPDRYRRGDAPVDLRFVSASDAVYEDGLGEFEISILLSELVGTESVASSAASGWGGDRYAVFRDADAYALVWWTVWDTDAAARRFNLTLQREWRSDSGRRSDVEQLTLGDRAAVRLVDAPEAWSRWGSLPEVELVQ